MKKALCVVLSLILLLFPASNARAEEANGFEQLPGSISVYNPKEKQFEEIVPVSIIPLKDGCRMVTSEIAVLSANRASGEITGSRQQSFYDSNNVLLWRVTLTGSFTYNGSSAYCTKATSVTDVFSGNWSESSNNTYPSGNTAIANVTVVRKFLFIAVETQNVVLTMNCDRYGNLY